MSRQSPRLPPGGKHATIREPTRRETVMANRRSGKLWTPGLFEKPGMDQELMAQLLPRPQYRRFNGRSVPIGTGTMSGPQRPTRGLSGQIRGPAPPTCRPPRLRPSGSRPLLGRAWQGRPREKQRGCWPDIITRPLVSPPPRSARGRGLRSNQISGFLNQFLSLGTRCDEAQLPGVLTHFVQAGVWLGDHPDAPLAGLVKPSIPGFSGPPRNRSSSASPPPSRRPICRRCCR